jgi:hypothetical protein
MVAILAQIPRTPNAQSVRMRAATAHILIAHIAYAASVILEVCFDGRLGPVKGVAKALAATKHHRIVGKGRHQAGRAAAVKGSA